MFSTPRVMDHTDFSFSRVERSEVTDYASLHPPYWPKISRSTQKDCQVPFILTYSLSNKLSVMCFWWCLYVSNLTTPPRASQTWTGAHPWGGKWGQTESRSSNVTDLSCRTLGTASAVDTVIMDNVPYDWCRGCQSIPRSNNLHLLSNTLRRGCIYSFSSTLVKKAEYVSCHSVQSNRNQLLVVNSANSQWLQKRFVL